MTREGVPPGNHLPASSRGELRDRPMTPRVLIVYASKKGSTREVAQAIADRLEVDGLRTVVQPASDPVDLGAFDAVVVGGALYMGRWHRDARRFLHRHRRVLGTMPVAVYAMGPTTMADHAVKLTRATRARARVGARGLAGRGRRLRRRRRPRATALPVQPDAAERRPRLGRDLGVGRRARGARPAPRHLRLGGRRAGASARVPGSPAESGVHPNRVKRLHPHPRNDRAPFTHRFFSGGHPAACPIRLEEERRGH